MKKLLKLPSEEIYMVELLGQFIPENFSPFWFSKNNLLGKIEAENVNIIEITAGHCSNFSTEFLEINVEVDSFKIYARNLLSYDLVNDMALNVSKLLSDSLYPLFSIFVNLHFTFKKKNEFEAVLNKFIEINNWEKVFEKPKAKVIQVNEFIEHKYYQEENRISVSPCQKPNTNNTIHLYLRRSFKLVDDKILLRQLIEENIKQIDSSIEIINKTIKTFF